VNDNSKILLRRSQVYPKLKEVGCSLTFCICESAGKCQYKCDYSINTFTAKVDRGRFKYLRFKLPASTLVDLKFTLLFCLK
jgi:hypothetical protein